MGWGHAQRDMEAQGNVQKVGYVERVGLKVAREVVVWVGLFLGRWGEVEVKRCKWLRMDCAAGRYNGIWVGGGLLGELLGGLVKSGESKEDCAWVGAVR